MGFLSEFDKAYHGEAPPAQKAGNGKDEPPDGPVVGVGVLLFLIGMGVENMLGGFLMLLGFVIAVGYVMLRVCSSVADISDNAIGKFRDGRRCPHCAEIIQPKAILCPHCHSKL